MRHTEKRRKIFPHFFLYCLTNKRPDAKTPEAVLFHELGHAIHARWTKDSRVIPPKIVQFLKDLCFPQFDTLPPDQQSEVLADILSVGLMYKSPFAQHDAFSYIHPDDKAVFRELVERILKRI